MRQIAISDIHGHVKTFRTMVEKVVQLTHEDELYLLGDYIDRGPDSKGVIDYILQLKQAGYTVRCLRGNHEEMMLQARWSERYHDMWTHNGGQATLRSFRVLNSLKEIPERYWWFLDKLEYYIELDDYFLVHAGFDFRLYDPFNVEEKEACNGMLWIRPWTWYNRVDEELLEGKMIVHGHTPTAELEIRRQLRKQPQPILCIDNGAYYSRSIGKGQLCAFDLTNKALMFLPVSEDPIYYYSF